MKTEYILKRIFQSGVVLLITTEMIHYYFHDALLLYINIKIRIKFLDVTCYYNLKVFSSHWHWIYNVWCEQRYFFYPVSRKRNKGHKKHDSTDNYF